MDPLVSITGDSTGIDFVAGALPHRVSVTTYMIGTFGPYEARLPVDQATPEAVQAAIQAKVNYLRGLGAI